jgi:predicted cation transporter
MHLAHPILVALLITAGTASIVTSNVIFYQILNEVNSRRPLEQQFSLFSPVYGLFKITRGHARLFLGEPYYNDSRSYNVC